MHYRALQAPEMGRHRPENKFGKDQLVEQSVLIISRKSLTWQTESDIGAGKTG
jgi:hypothetical protein